MEGNLVGRIPVYRGYRDPSAVFGRAFDINDIILDMIGVMIFYFDFYGAKWLAFANGPGTV